MKTFKLTVTEEELRALIDHHVDMHGKGDYEVERSERIHTLTKRLNRDTPEIEGTIDPPQATAAKEEQQTGW